MEDSEFDSLLEELDGSELIEWVVKHQSEHADLSYYVNYYFSMSGPKLESYKASIQHCIDCESGLATPGVDMGLIYLDKEKELQQELDRRSEVARTHLQSLHEGYWKIITNRKKCSLISAAIKLNEYDEDADLESSYLDLKYEAFASYVAKHPPEWIEEVIDFGVHGKLKSYPELDARTALLLEKHGLYKVKEKDRSKFYQLLLQNRAEGTDIVPLFDATYGEMAIYTYQYERAHDELYAFLRDYKEFNNTHIFHLIEAMVKKDAFKFVYTSQNYWMSYVLPVLAKLVSEGLIDRAKIISHILEKLPRFARSAEAEFPMALIEEINLTMDEVSSHYLSLEKLAQSSQSKLVNFGLNLIQGVSKGRELPDKLVKAVEILSKHKSKQVQKRALTLLK